MKTQYNSLGMERIELNEDEYKGIEFQRSNKKKGMAKVRDIIENIIIGICLIIITTVFILFYIHDRARVCSESMEPVLMTEDTIVRNKFAYAFKNPERGDIICFDKPDVFDKELSKRVIGLPGEVIRFRGNKIYINGVEFVEEYIGRNIEYEKGDFLVPKGCYFVMGDNREVSSDSRYWDEPYVEKEQINSKVVAIKNGKVEILPKVSYDIDKIIYSKKE